MKMNVPCALCDTLGSNDGNFLSTTDEAKKNHAHFHFTQSKIIDDGITEEKIFRQCFAICQPKMERSVLSKVECRKSLLALCKSLIKQRPKSGTIDCNMCGLSISTSHTINAVTHACAHLEVKLFQCRHCDRSFSSESNVSRHIRQAHKISKPTDTDSEDKSVERFDEIVAQIKRCFSTNYPRSAGLERQFVTKGGRQSMNQRSVVHFCRSIFLQRSKPATLDCNQCGSRIILRQRHGFFMPYTMSQHAAAHLDIKLFTCRHCNHSMSTKHAMRVHLRTLHQITDGNTDDFEDRSDELHSEHLSTIERCFSGDPAKLEKVSAGHRPSICAEAKIRNQTIGSELAVERRLLCNRLIRKIVDSDGRIKCSVCSKRLGGKPAGRSFSRDAAVHAETHLRKPLYRCKVCKIQFNTRPNIMFHLRTKHALGLEKNYECVADEFHEEIMAMLSKCYTAVG